jgi:hypothetical protein
MKGLFPLVVLLVVITFSCEQKKNLPTTSAKLQGLHQYFYPTGELYLEVNYQDSLPHGASKQYFKNGQLFEETQYVRGERHGISKKFFDNGQMSSENYYDSGRLHGVQKKYRRDGKPAYEAPYYYGKPCVGLKEYFVSGNPVNNYPSIVIKPEDRMLKESMYILNISLSDKSNLVEFYKGTLTEGKYIDRDAMELPTAKGVARLYYVLPPGAFAMEKLNIIAKIKTDLNNFYVTQVSYNLAVENTW